MDFNVKKLVGDAGTFFNRAVQVSVGEKPLVGSRKPLSTFMTIPNNNVFLLFKFTEEKLGTSEKTELDAHFENLQQRCDMTKSWTEKLIRDVDAVLATNPSKQYLYIYS